MIWFTQNNFGTISVIFVAVLLIHILRVYNIFTKLFTFDIPTQDVFLYNALVHIYIKPEAGLLRPGQVKLEDWERTTGFWIMGLVSYIGLVKYLCPLLILGGALAGAEI